MKTTIETNLETSLQNLLDETILGQTYRARSNDIARERVLSTEGLAQLRLMGSRKVHNAQCYCNWCDRHDEALDVTPAMSVKALG